MLDGFDRRSSSPAHGAQGGFSSSQPLGELFGEPSSTEEPLGAALRELALSGSRVLAAVRGARLRDDELSVARKILHDLDAALRLAPRAPSCTMAVDGSWFELGAERVDLSRRCSVRRILAALIQERRASTGRALDVHELFELGWPGERIPYESQVRRVYTAIWTLRRLGLDALLLTREGGYLLDAKQGIELED
jgi:hypothetical protein